MRIIGAAAASLALLVPAPAGAAFEPSASVTMTDLGPLDDGRHRVRLDYTVSCGPGTTVDAVSSESFLGLVEVPKRAGARPVETRRGYAPDQLSGSREDVAFPGSRVFARVRLVCDDGEVTARTQADTPNQIFVPPRLVGWATSRGSYCGATRRERARGIGASDFQTLDWKLSFNRTSMLESPSTAGLLKEVRLRASGRGLHFRYRPESGALRRYQEFRGTIFSPRSGRVTLWAEVGGVSTNKITLPVVGKPCVRNPKSYYGSQVMRRANPFIRD